MKLKCSIFLLLCLGFCLPLFASVNHFAAADLVKNDSVKKDSIDEIDALKTVKDITNRYYFNSAVSRSSYVHIKERLEILQYIKSLNWTEKEKIEIFKLYTNTSYHSEPHETELKKYYNSGKLGEVLKQNLQKLQQRIKEIAGEEGCKTFWTNIELITDKYTDHSQF
jgi:hypothetical protein